MKPVENALSILEIAYPLDPAFDDGHASGTTSYQAPNIKIQLDRAKDYRAIYQQFAESAGITESEYDGPYQEDGISQSPYYTCRHIICFKKRENIIKAINFLEKSGLIPDTDDGKKLLNYRQSMFSEEKYQAAVETKNILDWQYFHFDTEIALSELKNHLLNELNKSIAALKTNSPLSAEDIQTRETYLQELTHLIHTNNDEILLEKISEGKKRFNHGDGDLAFVLLRKGEDVIQQYHVDHHLVYRRDVYRNVFIAAGKYKLERLKKFNYTIDGDPEKALPYLMQAAQATSDYLGSPEAQFEIAMLSKLQLISAKADEKLTHDEKAVQFYTQAAERGHTEAMTKLGKMWMFGEGVEEQNSVRAVKYFEKVIGNKVRLWESEPLEYILALVECEDRTAIEFLKNKMSYHQQEFFKQQDAWLILIKENPKEFIEKAEDFRYGNSYVAAGSTHSAAGIMHLRQLHFLADSGSTDYMVRSKGFIIAKQILVETYQKLAQICKQHSMPDHFSAIADCYQKRIADQIEKEKPKPKSPSELLLDSIKKDDSAEFENQLIAFYQSTSNPSQPSLSESKFSVNLTINGSPLICLAAKEGSLAVVRLLISKDADVQAKTDKGENALQETCRLFWLDKEVRKENRLEIAKLLVEHGVSVNLDTGQEYTALHNAALSEFDEIVEFLLTKKADIDARDYSGRTPLNLLIEQRKNDASPSTVEILLKNGASINAKNNINYTPLMLACYFCPELKPLLQKYQRPSEGSHLSKHAEEAQQSDKKTDAADETRKLATSAEALVARKQQEAQAAQKSAQLEKIEMKDDSRKTFMG